MARRMYDENQIKSIASEVGGGKIYNHRITLQRVDSTLRVDYFIKINIYSSSDIAADSITDLKTLLGNTFNISASGYYKNFSDASGTYKVVYALNQVNVYYFDISNGAGATTLTKSDSTLTITDTVTEI